MAETNFSKSNDVASFTDWLNDTEQIKELQEACETAERDLEKELYFNSAVLEVTKILDEYDKLNASLLWMSNYLMQSGFSKPEVYKKILMCHDNVLKSNTCFIEVGNELYDILIEKEKMKNV